MASVPCVVKIPEILLPNDGIDPSKWAVVACDQFTSEPEYWDGVERLTKNFPSAYHITYPEIYLGKNQTERVEKINENMKKYLGGGIFKTVKGFVLVERETKYSKARFGLVISVDLEAYDFKPFNKAYIKATEGTILERLPVRIGIRENASLELPHILLLADDEKKAIIEPIAERRGELEKLYDFDLMKDGGHIRGYLVGADAAKDIAEKIYSLLDKDAQTEKYGSAEVNFFFAVGDGNHSLATAKACWERLKTGLSEKERENHPARYALAELVNLYDDALKFEPIHRAVFNADGDFLEGLKKIEGEGRIKVLKGGKEFETVKEGVNVVSDGGMEFEIGVNKNSAEAIGEIQGYIEEYLRKNPRTAVDYIHGEEHLRAVIKGGGYGILMPKIEKNELFPYVVNRGVLPKKAFSMGEAEEKRYYLEAKLIK
ncbi:MAG: DUF1015 domain-containing protein [Clostridiales bacterium]|jgi:hypothetical protein|nr:DUF1015 domain-containing protein [Clostridiales bacterium]